MKRVISMLLCIMIIAGALSYLPFTAAAATTYSGSLSSTVCWELDTNEGVLTIYGTGAIPAQPYTGKPWSSYDKYIKHIVIEDGITQIGENAFSEMRYFEDIVIPQGVTGIDRKAFECATAMKTVYIPLSCTWMGFCAFNYCWGLTDVYYEGTASQFNAISKTYAGLGGFDDLFNATKHYNYVYESDKQVYDYTQMGEATDIMLSVYDKSAFSNVNVANAIKDKSYAEICGAEVKTETETYGPYEELNRIKIKYEESGPTNAIVSKASYYDYIIPQEVAYSWYENNIKAVDVFMAKDKKDSKPFVSTVYARNSKTSNDANEKQYLEVQTNPIQILNGAFYDIVISAGGYEGDLTYCLAQDSTLKISNHTGKFYSKELYSSFEKDRDVYAYVKTQEGVTSAPVKLNFEFIETDSALGKLLTSNTFNLLGASGTKLTLADDVPLVGGLELGMNTKWPIGVQFENNKVKISFGLDVFDLKGTNGNATEFKWGDFKKSCQILNNTGKSIEDSQDKLDTYNYLFKHYREKYGVDSYQQTSNSLNMDVFGYLEAQIEADGTFHVTEFCGTIAAHFAVKYTKQAAVWVVPAYFYVEAGVDASIQFDGAKVLPDSDVPFDFGIDLKIDPGLRVGGGAGIKGAVSAGVWGEGSLLFENNFSTKYRKLELRGEFGLEAEFFVFDGDLTLLSGTKTLIDKYYGDNAEEAALLSSNSNEQANVKLISRDYLQSTTSFGSTTSYSLRRKSSEHIDTSVMQASIFSNTQTQVVQFGDKLLMTWIEDDDARDTYNRMRLVFSVYDPDTDTWTDPQAVDDSGTLDSAPSLATDGTNVYVAWQNVKKAILGSETNPVDTILSSSEIKVAQFNSANNTFENVQILTDNNTYDYAPSMSVENGEAVVCWVNTTSTSFAEKTFSINRYEEGEAIQSQFEGLNYILSMVSTNSDISYVMDLDGSTATVDDVYIFRNGMQIPTETSVEIPDVSYGVVSQNTVLFFVDDGNIYYESNGKIVQVTDNSAANGNLTVIQNGNNVSLIYTESLEQGEAIHLCSYTDEAWTGSVKITDCQKEISHLAGGYCADRLNLLCNQTEFIEATTEEGVVIWKKGQTDLCRIVIKDYYDAAISVSLIDESAFQESGAMSFDVRVTNNGTQIIEAIEFGITDGVDTTNIMKDMQLKPGQSETICVEFVPASVLDVTEIIVTAEAMNTLDVNPEDNTIKIELGSCDLSIQDLSVQTIGTVYKITGTISNNNCVTAQEVVVEVTRNGEKYIIDIGEIPGKDCYLIDYFVDKSLVEYADNVCKVDIEANTSTKEAIKENNSSAVYLIYDSNDWTASATTTCRFGDHNIVEHNEKSATCTQQGNIYCFRCLLCGKYFSDATCQDELTYSDVIIPAPGHTSEVLERVLPTCVDKGYDQCKCTICGIEYIDAYVDAKGHSFINDICIACQQEKADCIESSHNYSNNCDQTWTIFKEDAIKITVTFSKGTIVENNYDYIFVYDATDNLIGQYTGTELSGKCITVNGDTVKIRLTSDSTRTEYGFAISEVKAVYGLCFAGASLSLQHNLAVNYKVDKSLFEDMGYTDPYVIFERNGVQTRVSNYTVSGDRYVFTFRNIAPNQMNDTISAVLYATYDGNEYASAIREYSVAEYCYSMLDLCAADEYAELRTLLVDLLHYGAASQVYTGYRTDALVNAALTAEQLQWGTSADPALDTVLDTAYKTVENPSAKWKGAGLNLQDSVAMRLEFTADSIEGLSVKIESETNTWTISSDKFLEEDGVYYVYFVGLDAGQMRQSVYLTICEGNTPVSNTVCYSIGSYAYEKQNSTIAGLSELVKAMMKYGDSAYAYAH